MCVIIAKSKKSRLPSEEELENCFTFNNDGAGFMYTENNKVIVDKGYMKYKSFIKRYKELCEKFDDFENKSLVIHCRITTDGSTSVKNCHPFAVCDSIKKMQTKKTVSPLGVAHNGIISDYRPDTKDDKAPDISDTINFIKNYLAPIYKDFKNFYKNQAFLDGVELITNSKFAFLDGDDFLTTCGDFIDEDGLLFSNNSFKKYYSYYSNYNYNNYYYDDFYDDYIFEETETENVPETIREKNYLIKLEDNFFAEIIDDDSDADEPPYIVKFIHELKKDDNSLMYYNPYNYSIIEIDQSGAELQVIKYVNVYDENYELII